MEVVIAAVATGEVDRNCAEEHHALWREDMNGDSALFKSGGGDD